MSAFPAFRWLFLLLCLPLVLVSSLGCRSPFPFKTSDAYRVEEVALLKITAENIMDLEKAKDYASIYNEYASRDYKKRVPKRKFLKLTHCVEVHMGEVLGHDVAKLNFNRTRKGKHISDQLNLSVYRKNGTITERYTLIDEGLGFRITGFRWVSDNEPFAQCMKKINQTSRGKKG